MEETTNKPKILVGTSGWSYPKGEGTWNGTFYPKGERDELSYYSQHFKTVEINSSFYAPLSPDYASRWVDKTPADFVFSVKLWQKFTHPKMFEASSGQPAVISQADVELFRKGIEPIRASGKLGPVLVQFPPSFENNVYGWQILGAVLDTFKDLSLAIELRHFSWSRHPRTEQVLREYNVAWVQTDEPRFSISSAEELPLTANFAYFRFHGRNREYWWTGNNETRYKYLYSEEELKELLNRVGNAASKSAKVFVYFNNHWRGDAPKNAAQFEILSAPYSK